ncbi:hypothetical protein A2U01_0089584, partial [Trifolium medium]|nr:hypothetical protein [Trifolium medium]
VSGALRRSTGALRRLVQKIAGGVQLVARCAGHQDFITGGFGFLRVAQIHVARRAYSYDHPACGAGSGARCASAKSI